MRRQDETYKPPGVQVPGWGAGGGMSPGEGAMEFGTSGLAPSLEPHCGKYVAELRMWGLDLPRI